MCATYRRFLCFPATMLHFRSEILSTFGEFFVLSRVIFKKKLYFKNIFFLILRHTKKKTFLVFSAYKSIPYPSSVFIYVIHIYINKQFQAMVKKIWFIIRSFNLYLKYFIILYIKILWVLCVYHTDFKIEDLKEIQLGWK